MIPDRARALEAEPEQGGIQPSGRNSRRGAAHRPHHAGRGVADVASSPRAVQWNVGPIDGAFARTHHQRHSVFARAISGNADVVFSGCGLSPMIRTTRCQSHHRAMTRYNLTRLCGVMDLQCLCREAVSLALRRSSEPGSIRLVMDASVTERRSLADASATLSR